MKKFFIKMIINIINWTLDRLDVINIKEYDAMITWLNKYIDIQHKEKENLENLNDNLTREVEKLKLARDNKSKELNTLRANNAALTVSRDKWKDKYNKIVTEKARRAYCH